MQCFGLSLSRVCKLKVAQKCCSLGHSMFNRYLLITNVGISMSLSAFGDVLQQQYEVLQREKRQWDCVRTCHMSVSGITVGILCHHTYRYLDLKFPGRTIKTVFKKVVIDQLVCSPMCIGVFFLTLACLEHSNFETLVREVTEKGWRLYFAEWLIWPPAQVINFYLLPSRFRVLYDNTISLGFDVYTSYVKHEIPLKDVTQQAEALGTTGPSSI